MCDQSHTTRVYYKPATRTRRAHCEGCGSTAQVGFVILLVMGFLAAGVLRALVIFHRRSESFREAWRRFTPNVKLKVNTQRKNYAASLHQPCHAC